MDGMLRRLLLSVDSKITLHEFAQIIQPVELKHYLERIKNRTKRMAAERSSTMKNTEVKSYKQSLIDKLKPLTAF